MVAQRERPPREKQGRRAAPAGMGRDAFVLRARALLDDRNRDRRTAMRAWVYPQHVERSEPRADELLQFLVQLHHEWRADELIRVGFRRRQSVSRTELYLR